jgi:hypothetical protein
MTNKTKNCRHCCKSISEAATICFHCNKSQIKWRAWLESFPPLLSIISIMLSVALVSLSIMQFLEAREQRESASQALENALKASAKAEEATSTAEQARDETRKTFEQFRANIKLLLELEHLTTKLVTDHSNIEEKEKAVQKLEEFAVPNEKERRDWLETLRKKRGKP